MQDLRPFFAAKHFVETEEIEYNPLQWGHHIQAQTSDYFDLDAADVVIVGCGEMRGENRRAGYSDGPDKIRAELYRLYNWHSTVRIADAGNILQGKSVDDTRAALRMVLHELHLAGKTAIVLGGSHDLTLQQYDAFKLEKQGINAVVADMLVDLEEGEGVTAHSFLMELLASNPNYVRHYTHLGFQSYYIQPRMLETLDKLRFDFTRLGRLRERLDEAEPALRSADLFSFDLSTVRYSDAPGNNRQGSPNGLFGDEACSLARYAGMSHQLRSFGIYGYHPEWDEQGMTAKLVSQMLWYFADGLHVRASEAAIEDRDQFSEFHITSTSNDVMFLKSKRTARWWMQLPDGRFVPCAYSDYVQATQDEIPERWYREQERLS
jgi:formiminoglutamase